MAAKLRFNPPPGWPKPPPGWSPPKGWTPDPSWPKPPPGWELWLPEEAVSGLATTADSPPDSVQADTTHENATEKSVRGDAPPASAVNLRARLRILEAENQALRAQLSRSDTDAEPVELNDEHVLQNVGIYRYHHPLENARQYKDELVMINQQVAELVKSDQAINRSTAFTFDNSIAKGRKMTKDLGILMLRAYNAQVDISMRVMRAGNVETAKKRIDKTRSAIAKLGSMMEMSISRDYHALRIKELELNADYLMKKQEEREAAKEERARLREEKRAQAELTAERERLEKERKHLQNAILSLLANGENDDALEKKLNAIEASIEQNDYRQANVRAGYIYVISNRGAFGPGVVKIGLTRRLEPMDRVVELGDASVPFRFDVHALFFSEDAVSLEAELHERFTERRLNMANRRKEFFFASPTEVGEVLADLAGNLLEFNAHAESTEFLQSLKYWPSEHRGLRQTETSE